MANEPSPIDLQRHLGGIDYPATKEQLISHAKDSGAPSDVMDRLQTIADREYEGPSGVVKEFSNG